jgi:hypothetical protein
MSFTMGFNGAWAAGYGHDAVGGGAEPPDLSNWVIQNGVWVDTGIWTDGTIWDDDAL